MPRLTVLIPCKNERRNIRACLESAQPIADEILVADSGSTDGTLELARQTPGVRIIEREYVNSADFKNWAIPQAACEWVLVLDADERVSPELATEIRALLKGELACDGYSVYRENFFLGHRIRHCGWSNTRLVRLFRRDRGRYQKRRVHADLDLPAARVAPLRWPLVHHTALDLDHFITRQQRYAMWAALDQRDRGQRSSWLRIMTHAPLRFLQLYLLRGGFLDGRAGLIVCGLMGYYTFLKDAQLWSLEHTARALQRAGGEPQSEPSPAPTVASALLAPAAPRPAA